MPGCTGVVVTRLQLVLTWKLNPDTAAAARDSHIYGEQHASKRCKQQMMMTTAVVSCLEGLAGGPTPTIARILLALAFLGARS